MNKYYALKKDVFDISKVTVVGSPTITSDGVVTATSGYGTNCPWIYNIPALGKNWEMIFPYKANTTTYHTAETIFREMKTGYSYFSIGSYGTHLYLWLKDVDGTGLSFNLGNFKQLPFGDMLIKLKCSFENNVYILRTYISQNGGNWVAMASKTSEIAFFPCENEMNFCIMVLEQDENASVNLPQLKIYSNNQLIYSPTKPTYLIERRNENYYMLRR